MAKVKQSIKAKKSPLLKLSKTQYEKIAISLPGEDLSRIEEACKQFNLSRSKFMLIAVRHWFEAQKKQFLLNQYIRGYEVMPEDVKVSQALTVMQSRTLAKESW